MPINFKCSHCSCGLSMPDGSEGKVTHCQFCQQSVIVPSLGDRSGGSSAQMRAVGGTGSSRSLPSVGPRSNRVVKPQPQTVRSNTPKGTLVHRDANEVVPKEEPKDPTTQLYAIMGAIVGFCVIVIGIFLFRGEDEEQVNNAPPPPPPPPLLATNPTPVAPKVEPKKETIAPPPKIDGQVTAWPTREEIYTQAVSSTCMIIADRKGARTIGMGVLINQREKLVIAPNKVVVPGADYYILFPRFSSSGKVETLAELYLESAVRADFSASLLISNDVRPGVGLGLFQLTKLPSDVAGAMLGVVSNQPADRTTFTIAGVNSDSAPLPTELWQMTVGKIAESNDSVRMNDRTQMSLKTVRGNKAITMGSPIFDSLGTLIGLTSDTPEGEDGTSVEIGINAIRSTMSAYVRKLPLKPEDMKKYAEEIRFPGLKTAIAQASDTRGAKVIIETLVQTIDPNTRYGLIAELYNTQELARPHFDQILQYSERLTQGERRPFLALVKQFSTDSSEIPELTKRLEAAKPAIISLCLARLENAESIPGSTAKSVAKFLRDPDPSIRKHALKVLGKSSTEELKSILPIMTATVEDWDADVVIEAIEQLRKVGDQPGVKTALVKTLRSNNPEITKVAIASLEKLPAPNSSDLDDLQKWLVDDKDAVRKFALSQLIKLGPDASPVLPELLKRSDPTNPAAERVLALEAMAGIGERVIEQVIPVFLKASKDSENDVAKAARMNLPKFGHNPKILSLLIDLIGSEDKEISKDSASILKSMEPFTDLDVNEFTKRLKDGNASQVDSLLRILPKDPKYLETILPILKKWATDNSASGVTREVAGNRLLMLGRESWLDVAIIQKILSDPTQQPGPRRIAAKMLLRTLETVKDPKEIQPYKSAANALKTNLKEILTDQAIEPSLELVLIQLLLASGEASGPVVTGILKLYSDSKSQAELEPLFVKYDDELIPSIVMELKSQTPAVRLSAVRILAKIGKEGSTINRLAEISGNRREEDEIRTAAKEAIDQIKKRKK
jgi:HEAT repeat protein